MKGFLKAGNLVWKKNGVNGKVLAQPRRSQSMSGAVPATSDMKSPLRTTLSFRRPGDPIPSKAHAPTVFSASSASDALKGKHYLITPLSIPDRVCGLMQKYDVSIKWIVLPLITGLGLVLFGKVAAAVLAGKVLLGVAGLACVHQIHHIWKMYRNYYNPTTGLFVAMTPLEQSTPYTTEIHYAIQVANEKSMPGKEINHAGLKYALHMNKNDLQTVTLSNLPPLGYAEKLGDPVAVAMIEAALKRNIATAASAKK